MNWIHLPVHAGSRYLQYYTELKAKLKGRRVETNILVLTFFENLLAKIYENSKIVTKLSQRTFPSFYYKKPKFVSKIKFSRKCIHKTGANLYGWLEKYMLLLQNDIIFARFFIKTERVRLFSQLFCKYYTVWKIFAKIEIFRENEISHFQENGKMHFR
jgi:hypothetical protein